MPLRDSWSSLEEEQSCPEVKCIVREGAGDIGDGASRLAGRFLELMQEKRSRETDDMRYDDQVGGQMVLTDGLPAPAEKADVINREGNNNKRKADRFSDEVIEFYFELLHFIDVYDRLDKRYRIYTEITDSGDMRLKLLCVDPSHNLAEYLAYGRSAVFFSATLLPVTYYMDLLAGSRDDYTVYASSIFDPSRLGIYRYGSHVKIRQTRR